MCLFNEAAVAQSIQCHCFYPHLLLLLKYFIMKDKISIFVMYVVNRGLEGLGEEMFLSPLLFGMVIYDLIRKVTER